MCGATGKCLATKRMYKGDLGGLRGADQLCQSEYSGSHFYRASCDADRNRNDAFGYAELELGACWNCNGWTSADSGAYAPRKSSCTTGYATVGAILPRALCASTAADEHCWRICEAGDKPLICCTP